MSDNKKDITVEIKENWYKNLLPKFAVKKIIIIENNGNIKIHNNILLDVDVKIASNHIFWFISFYEFYGWFDRNKNLVGFY